MQNYTLQWVVKVQMVQEIQMQQVVGMVVAQVHGIEKMMKQQEAVAVARLFRQVKEMTVN